MYTLCLSFIVCSLTSAAVSSVAAAFCSPSPSLLVEDGGILCHKLIMPQPGGRKQTNKQTRELNQYSLAASVCIL